MAGGGVDSVGSLLMTHVLIVDDDRIVRKIVETNLTGQGYKVTVAGDGLEGLNALMTEKPDVTPPPTAPVVRRTPKPVRRPPKKKKWTPSDL